MKPIHVLLVVIVNVVWGSMYIAAAIGLEEFPAIFFTGLRFCLLTVLLASYIRAPREYLWPLFKIGALIGIGVYLSLYMSIALAENTGAIAVFSKLEVPFSLILGYLILAENVGPRQIAGTLIAFIGAVLISFDPAAFDDIPALLWMGVSAAFSAYSMIQVRKIPDVHPLTITAWVSMVGGPTLMILSGILEADQVAAMANASALGWIMLIYTAVGSSIFAHSAYYYLLQRYPVAQVTPFTLMSSVFAVIGGIIFLDDQLTLMLVLGGILILAGVTWINLRKAKVTAPAQPA